MTADQGYLIASVRQVYVTRLKSRLGYATAKRYPCQ